jgi:hypothetical protein
MGSTRSDALFEITMQSLAEEARGTFVCAGRQMIYGVNLPVDRVLVDLEVDSYDEMKQVCGRAGRTGRAARAEIVFCRSEALKLAMCDKGNIRAFETQFRCSIAHSREASAHSRHPSTNLVEKSACVQEAVGQCSTEEVLQICSREFQHTSSTERPVQPLTVLQEQPCVMEHSMKLELAHASSIKQVALAQGESSIDAHELTTQCTECFNKSPRCSSAKLPAPHVAMQSAKWDSERADAHTPGAVLPDSPYPQRQSSGRTSAASKEYWNLTKAASRWLRQSETRKGPEGGQEEVSKRISESRVARRLREMHGSDFREHDFVNKVLAVARRISSEPAIE